MLPKDITQDNTSVNFINCLLILNLKCYELIVFRVCEDYSSFNFKSKSLNMHRMRSGLWLAK